MASALVMLPFGPEADSEAGFRLFSDTTRWTAGDRWAEAGAWAEPVLAGAAAGAAAAGAAAAPEAEMEPMT
ncbi:hypothetical protein D3C71_2025230 [compost metagenome]